MVDAVAKAIAAVGSEAAFARIAGMSQQAVNKMVRRRRLLGPTYVLKVESATGISRHDLRPDIYGPRPALLDAPAYESAR